MFIGYVERSEPTPARKYSPQIAWVRVEEPFKGVGLGQLVVLDQPGHNCAWKPQPGKRYLFYLHPSEGHRAWEALGCHRTRSTFSK